MSGNSFFIHTLPELLSDMATINEENADPEKNPSVDTTHNMHSEAIQSHLERPQVVLDGSSTVTTPPNHP
jgi:hypothetical protein